MNISVPQAVNLTAIESLGGFLDKYPSLSLILKQSKHPSQDWDFFMTVAGTGLYLYSRHKTDEEIKNVSYDLAKIHKEMPAAMNNYLEFTYNSMKAKEAEVNAVTGIWILWNIMGHAPEYEESKALAPAIGTFLSLVISEFL